MRFYIGLTAVLSLSACLGSSIPDSAEPANQKAGSTLHGPLSALASGSSVDIDASVPSGSLSNEQDFQAVSDAVSLEKDAERLQAYREAFVEIKPEAVPERPEGTSISVVQFALDTTNKVGESKYRRIFAAGEGRQKRNCAVYASADFAQIAFLEAGGPKIDRIGLDPDGDGFACGWNPEPYRKAREPIVDEPLIEDSGVSAADLAAIGISASDSSILSDDADAQSGDTSDEVTQEISPAAKPDLNISSEQ